MSQMNGFRTFAERTVEEKLKEPREWWNKPNKAFDGMTPEEAWERNATRVVTWLMDLKK